MGNCEICNEKFVATSNRQKYCPKCKAGVNREHALKNYFKNHEENKIKRRIHEDLDVEKTCIYCQKKFIPNKFCIERQIACSECYKIHKVHIATEWRNSHGE